MIRPDPQGIQLIYKWIRFGSIAFKSLKNPKISLFKVTTSNYHVLTIDQCQLEVTTGTASNNMTQGISILTCVFVASKLEFNS